MKSKEIKEFLDDFSQNAFGTKRSVAIENCKCVMCGEKANKFKDVESLREYSISGMCQECQDKFLGE